MNFGHKRYSRKPSIPGFTLIELLVVIAIIGLLASIVVASVSSSRKAGRLAGGQAFDTSLSHTLPLAGEWRFDESGGTTANDTSGYDNNGAISGATYVAGVLGNALSFNGSDNYVNVASAPIIGNTSGFTYSLWVRVNSYTNGGAGDGNGTYFLDRTTGSNALISLKAIGDKFVFQKRYDDGSGLGGIFSTSNISLGTWTHVVLMRDTSNSLFKIFINGAKEGEVVDTGAALTPQPPKFGGHSTLCPGGGCFNGSMDTVRIYSSGLTVAEVQKMYAQEKPKHLATE
jgi:prepilin-type N-terminal cleavage/methylation domain-containing protein